MCARSGGLTRYVSWRRVLTGNPIGGALISGADGEFGALIDFSGVIVLVGAVLVLVARLSIGRKVWKVV